MKFIILIFSIIGVSFVEADVLGTLDSVLASLPNLDDATEGFISLSNALSQQTLLSGDTSEVVDEIENLNKALDSLSEIINSSTEIIDQTNTWSFHGVDQLISSLEHLASASGEFNEAITSTAGVSNLLLKSVPSGLLSNLANSVHELSNSFVAELNSIKSFEERCHISTGLDAPISNLASTTNTVYENLNLVS